MSMPCKKRESCVTTLLFTMLNTTVYPDYCVFSLGLLATPATEYMRIRFVSVDWCHDTTGKALRALCKYLAGFPKLNPVHG